MNHFMLIMEGYGIRPPPGEAYFAGPRAPTASSGFYVVSDGSDRPYRVRCRPPCLPPVAALHRMIEGEMVGRPDPDLRLREHDRRRARSMTRTAPAAPASPAGSLLAGAARRGPPAAGALSRQRGARCCRCCTWPRRRSAGSRSRPRNTWPALFDLSPAHVHEVVTFYTLYFQRAQGPPRRGGVPQPLLLPGGRAGISRAREAAARDRARRDHRRRPGHACSRSSACARARPRRWRRWTTATS